MFKRQKGQGALEYLLLIGGAIVVAVIVVTLLLGIGDSSGTQARSTAYTLAVKNYMATNGVGYWKFDEGSGTIVSDSSGNELDGTIVGASGGWVNGKFGKAIDFDNARNVNIPSNTLLGKPKNGITIAMWIYIPTDETLNDYEYLVSSNGYYFRNYSSNRLQAYLYRSGGNASILTPSGTGPINEKNKWMFMAITYTDSDSTNNAKIYMDIDADGEFQGTEIRSETETQIPINTPTTALGIGAAYNNTNRFNGYIDEVMLFDRALTQSELEVLAKG